jgi:hypothetical protein
MQARRTVHAASLMDDSKDLFLSEQSRDSEMSIRLERFMFRLNTSQSPVYAKKRIETEPCLMQVSPKQK